MLDFLPEGQFNEAKLKGHDHDRKFHISSAKARREVIWRLCHVIHSNLGPDPFAAKALLFLDLDAGFALLKPALTRDPMPQQFVLLLRMCN